MSATDDEREDEVLAFGPFRLLAHKRQLLGQAGPVKLGMRAFDLLVALTEEAGQICAKEELLRRVWPDEMVDEANLRIHIGTLRKALGDGRDGARYIVNIIGRGYSFVGAVTRTAAGQPLAIDEPAVPDDVSPLDVAAALPVRLTALLGREEAIAATERQLGQRRFVSLVGPGGIGKTALALELAHQRAAASPGAVFFVELSPGRNVASTVASALGLPVLTQDPAPNLVAHFSRRPTLLVLDGCEPVIEGAAALAEGLLRQVPGLTILATSREPLRAEGEWVHRLACLGLPPEDQTSTSAPMDADLRKAPAVQLFLDRAAASLANVPLTAEDLPAVAGLCRQLDGIPLAIELVAARTGLLGLAGLARGLDDGLLLRTQGRRTALPRHQTLRATLDWSFELLGSVEKIVLARLSVFQGSFALEAAAAVATGDALSENNVVDAVMGLAAKSLLMSEIIQGSRCYRLQRATRAYAAEKLAAQGQTAVYGARHAAYVLGRLELATRQLAELSRRQWIERHRPMIGDVRAAFSWAFARPDDPQLAIRLACAAAPMGYQLSLAREFLDHTARALALVLRYGTDLATEIRLNCVHGHLLVLQEGLSEEATACFTRAYDLAGSGAGPAERVAACRAMWSWAFARGEYAEALRYAVMIRDVARSTLDQLELASAERSEAIILHCLGRHDEARQHAAHNLYLAERANLAADGGTTHISRRVVMGMTLARSHWMLGNPDQAADFAAQTLAATEHDFAAGYCHAMALAALPVAVWRGDYSHAARLAHDLHDFSSRHASAYWRNWAELVLEILGSRSPLARQRTLERVRAAGDATLVDFLPTLADDLLTEQAVSRVQRGLVGWCAPETLRARALQRLKAGDNEGAESLLLSSLALARRHQALSWELRAATSLARLKQEAGQGAVARQVLAPVYERFSEGFGTRDLAEAAALLEGLGAAGL
ncbi:ATP-binding protein [Radicibacter daui]|uniref:ATP-binding protein n=1 Tax=Radicibacter daui TaxID=3064829 RepID=UPI004046AB68